MKVSYVDVKVEDEEGVPVDKFLSATEELIKIFGNFDSSIENNYYGV